jgi:hypothetical protein
MSQKNHENFENNRYEKMFPFLIPLARHRHHTASFCTLLWIFRLQEEKKNFVYGKSKANIYLMSIFCEILPLILVLIEK